MTIEIPYNELENIMNKASGRPVQVKCIGQDTVELHYIVSVKLKIAEISAQRLLLDYSMSPIVGMMIKGMKGKVREQLHKYPFVKWIEDKEQLSIELVDIPGASSLLEHVSVQSLNFKDDHVQLILRPS
jgi:hypothetical protein